MTQGFATFVARYFGEKNYEKVNKVLDKILPAHLCYVTNVNDNVNSEAVTYYGIVMNEIESVDVVFK